MSIENGHDELSNIFNDMRNSSAIWWYVTGNRGCFEGTCNSILMGSEYKKLNHNYELSEIDRFRYGLLISKETRERIKIIGIIK